MPVSPTWPGVYIQELPSGNRTIAGVTTSVTAFVGRAKRGPVHEATRISSFSDYQRTFGGLWMDSAMSYAVHHYYLSGGRDAVIVRVVGSGAVSASVRLPLQNVLQFTALVAASVRVEWETSGDYPDDRFTVFLKNTSTSAEEPYLVTMDPADTSESTRYYIADLAEAVAAGTIARVANIPAVRPPHMTEETTFAAAATGSATPVLILEALGGTGTYVATVAAHPTDTRCYLLDLGDGTASPTEKWLVRLDQSSTTTHAGYTEVWVGALSSFGSTLAEAVTIPYQVPVPGTYPFDDVTVAATGRTDGIPVPDVTLDFEAIGEGDWGNFLQLTIDYATSDDDDPALFNLTVEEVDADGNVVTTESFRNVTLDPDSSRYLPTVLEEESGLVTMDDASGYRHARFEVIADEPLTDGADGADITDSDLLGDMTTTGLYALDQTDIFNLLCLPPLYLGDGDADLDTNTWSLAIAYAESRRAVCIVDPPYGWTDEATARSEVTGFLSASSYAAIYFPRVKIADPLRQNRLTEFVPCGVIAGLIARTDGQRGVWKAPAGLDVRASIVRGLTVKLTDTENGRLNPLGLNCLRTFPSVGAVVWGARTLDGADRLASDWKYLPVRRIALYIEESLYRGLQWAVFEPNDEPLWAQVRLSAGGFMHQLFRQGAFKGSTPKEAYFVKCDSETTTDDDIDQGIVNVIVGFAPLKPAEFVIISIQQIAGQVSA